MLDKLYYKVMSFIVPSEKYVKVIAVKKSRRNGVKVGENCRLYSTNFSTEPYLIEIGNHVTITSGVKFITHDGAAFVARGLYKEYEDAVMLGKIKIGNNVFIGFNSLILPGVNLGDNCIVAAGSVVTKSFPDNSVIAGTPARYIKSVDEYIADNSKYFVNIMSMTKEQKREYITENMKEFQFKQN